MFIDDLDRASPDQVFEIFEAIKLYLDAPGFVFVIGYDNAVISEAVLEEKKYSHSVTGREYLEKIIQVGYRIATPDDDQAALLVDRYTGESGTGALFNEAARRLVLDRNQRNPRRIKRFLNAFVLLYALDPEWQQLGPERLVEVLLLDTHFAEFMTLFRAGSEVDPVAEFLSYRDERRKVFDGNPDADAVEAALRQLQRTLPEQYPLLVENPEFVALVESLHAAPQWIDVCYKLQRRRRTLTTAVPSAPSEPPPPGMTKGAPPSFVDDRPAPSVLWIGDQPTELGPVVEAIRRSGVEVTGALSAAEARRLLGARRYDAVIADVERESSADAGFDDLAMLRENDLYGGPVIFYTRRLTPERRERTQALGAAIVSDAGELQSLLTRPDVAPGVAK
jgi:CheY-like chemotaxis protein